MSTMIRRPLPIPKNDGGRAKALAILTIVHGLFGLALAFGLGARTAGAAESRAENSLRFDGKPWSATSKPSAPPSKARKPKHKIAPAKGDEMRPLHEQSFEEILRTYTFVGDFSQKPEERQVSEEIFWRYPYTHELLPKIDFPLAIEFAPSALAHELPKTLGSGRAIDHINRGRMLFLEKRFQEAKATWLSARARFGTENSYHRRIDYLLGYAFLNIALQHMKEGGEDFDGPNVRPNLANAATFLSWAFIVKADLEDPLLDAHAPKGLYNLAAIYWRYGRHAAAYGAAEKGLNFLRKSGRKDYRAKFHRLVAESFILNRSYLEAVQTLDTAIRQDPDRKDSAASFARVGDIYFDLNNYELAEDAYALGARIDEDLRQMSPTQLVLRGESLFWLARFSEAQKALHFALEGTPMRTEVAPLAAELRSWAALRLADAYFARSAAAATAQERSSLLDKARLEYFKVGHDFQASQAGRIAKIREACLELPDYEGKNVAHARSLLDEARVGAELPEPAVHIAWSCQVASYTQRERTRDMLERVRAFAESYPESKFLAQFREPVRAYQADRIDDYFAAGDPYRAMSFFEKNRKTLFPTVAPALAERLFVAYADAFRPQESAEFWPAYSKTADSDLKVLREITVAAELADKHPEWAKREKTWAANLASRTWTIEAGPLANRYLRRVVARPNLTLHLPWLLAIAKSWGSSNFEYVCDLEYPLLSRTFGHDSAKAKTVLARVDALTKNFLPELFRSDESCALSLLELEARILREDQGDREGLATLGRRYLARKDWPLVGGYLHLYWTMAEHIHEAGEQNLARGLWEILRDKSPPNAPERAFAKERLDRSRTELEKLWD